MRVQVGGVRNGDYILTGMEAVDEIRDVVFDVFAVLFFLIVVVVDTAAPEACAYVVWHKVLLELLDYSIYTALHARLAGVSEHDRDEAIADVMPPQSAGDNQVIKPNPTTLLLDELDDALEVLQRETGHDLDGLSGQ